MELNYFTDEIVLNKNKINNNKSILYLDNFLANLINKLQESELSLNDMSFFYKRNKKRESVLGIQISEGDIEDITNYLVFDCRSYNNGKDLRCKVGMQSDKKNRDKLNNLPYQVPADAINFFEKVEHLFNNSIQRELEIDNMVQVNLEKEKGRSVFR